MSAEDNKTKKKSNFIVRIKEMRMRNRIGGELSRWRVGCEGREEWLEKGMAIDRLLAKKLVKYCCSHTTQIDLTSI